MFTDSDVISSVDGLGRNGVMYAVHGNTGNHIECLELMISQAGCTLDHQANGDCFDCLISLGEGGQEVLFLYGDVPPEVHTP